MPENDDDSYEPFYLGYARVVQSSRSDFLAVGPNGGRLRVSRGQVHLDSELDGDLCDVGSEGDLTVTRWWAQSRKLKEAPPPPTPSPGDAPVHPRRSPSPRAPRAPRARNASDTREGPMAPEGFTMRTADSRESRHSPSSLGHSQPSDAPDGFTKRNS